MPDQSLGVAKSAASLASAGIVTIAVWAAKQFWAVDVPPEVAAAAAGVIGTVSVYVTPHNLGSGGTG